MISKRRFYTFLCCCALVLFLSTAAESQPYDFWQPMLHTEALQWPMPGHVVQFCSYARNGGNSDLGYYYGVDRGWNILCDVHGQGLVTQIWFTASPLADTSRIRIFVNDTVTALIDTSIKTFMGHMAPFTPPLADSMSGSWYCHVPIPFSSHVRITYRGSLIYYHVEALALDAGRTVTPLTMPPSTDFTAHVDSLRNRSSNPQQPAWATRSLVRVDTQTTLSAGATRTLLLRAGMGGCRRLFVRIGDHTQAIMENVWINIFTDYSPAPDLSGPLSTLFGAAQGWNVYRSAYTGMLGDSLYLNLPIAYQKQLRIEASNRTTSSQNITLSAELATLSSADIGPCKLRGIYHIENPTRPWTPYTDLAVKGKGCFIGDLLDMQGPGSYVLEGDETMFRDGETQPFWHGTGTDDYFLSGYYWAGARGCTALGFQGCIGFFRYGNQAAYRWFVCDPVPFNSSFLLNRDVGPWGQVAANYRSMAFCFLGRTLWEVADSSGDGKSFSGEALYLTGHHLAPGTAVRSVRWGNYELGLLDSVCLANNDSVVQVAVRAPNGLQQGCQWLTAQVGDHRDTVSSGCWTHVAYPDLLFIPRRADPDTFLSRGDTIDIDMNGLVPGATAQLFAGGYSLPWAGTPPIANASGSLRAPAVLNLPLSPGDYEIRALSPESPVAVCRQHLKLRSFYRYEVEEMDTAGWLGTSYQTQFGQDFALPGNTYPWGRGVIRFIQGNGVGAFLRVRFSMAVADTYRIAYFFGRTGGGAQIRTTIDSTVDINSYDSYFVTPGGWRYSRSDTVWGAPQWLSAGPHTLRFEMVGRNPQAFNWQEILDQIILFRDAAKFGTMPQCVIGLTAYRVSTGICLRWQSVQADTAGHPLVPNSYAIYRATLSDSLFRYLTEVPGSQTFFVDTSFSRPDTGTVFYCVTARSGIVLMPTVIRVWDQSGVAPVDMDNKQRR
jgi:hypothetical protein